MTSHYLTSTHSVWYERAAKFGLVIKGLVYCLSGAIALMASLHLGNNEAKDAGTVGVFSFIEDKPFGKWLLLVVAIGLACYTLWRWLQAFKDTEHKGNDKKGLGKRAAYFISGLTYAGVALYAFNAFNGSASGDSNAQQSWAAKLLSQPFGQWLAGLAAAIIIGIGLFQVYRAASGKYKKYVTKAIHSEAHKWVATAGVAGYSARGIVWLIIGWMFLKAALSANPGEAGGNEAAFGWLQNTTYGSLLLALVAAGLVCYGLFTMLRAKYQHIHTR